MNFKALLKSLLLRKFSSGLLLLQLALTVGLLVNSIMLALDTKAKLERDTNIPLDTTLVVQLTGTSGAFQDREYNRSIAEEDLNKIAQIPGVISVAPSVQVPIQYGGWNGNLNDVNDPDAINRDRYLKYVAQYHSTHKLAEILELKLVEGRYLDESDRFEMYQEGDKNIVISQSLKNALYPDESAIGKLTNQGYIVGVVEDMINNASLPEDKQYVLFSNMPIFLGELAQHYFIKTKPGQLDYVKSKVRDVILNVQPERDIFDVFSMREHVHKFYENDKGFVKLFMGLCGLMIFITAISSYAYAQFHMTQQTKLIGIRRALGATKKDIMLYVLTENWVIYCIGSVIGITAAIAFNISLSQHIPVTKPDVLVCLGVIVIMLISSTIATWWPARKTSAIPPVIATKTV